jgi:hypothetical protein
VKLLTTEELNARIESAKVLVSSYHTSRDEGFLKRALSMLLFRDHGLENYQPLYISDGATQLLGSATQLLVDHLTTPRSKIFPATSGKIRALGHNYDDFVVEHVVDVSSMVNHILKQDPANVAREVFLLGRTCPICIVTKAEDSSLKRSNRNNISNPWSEYDRTGIKRSLIRPACGPLT